MLSLAKCIKEIACDKHMLKSDIRVNEYILLSLVYTFADIGNIKATLEFRFDVCFVNYVSTVDSRYLDFGYLE